MMDETVEISSDESSGSQDPPQPEKKGFVLKRIQTDEEWFSKVGASCYHCFVSPNFVIFTVEFFFVFSQICIFKDLSYIFPLDSS